MRSVLAGLERGYRRLLWWPLIMGWGGVRSTSVMVIACLQRLFEVGRIIGRVASLIWVSVLADQSSLIDQLKKLDHIYFIESYQSRIIEPVSHIVSLQRPVTTNA